MHGLSWKLLLVWGLAIFFVVGSSLNAFNSKTIEEYRHWGYPNGFHYLTSLFELSTAALLLFEATRPIGLGLGALVMLAAIATVVLNREYAHAVAPFVVLAIIAVPGAF